MGIRVTTGGLCTTIQDAGRTGHQRFGVSVCGAVDQRSLAIANHLVGNDPGEAGIEVTLTGPVLSFEKATTIAITGGDLLPLRNGMPVAMYCALSVARGDVLSFQGVRTGCRSYIAFAGGLDVPPVMGSRSTDLKAGLGGWHGRKLEAGDAIGFRTPAQMLPGMATRQVMPDDFSGQEITIRVIMGPQNDAFTLGSIDTFLSQPFTISPAFDRMGCQLDGPVLAHVADGDILSDGVAFGSIQVPTGGHPIIMLADRQTTGGYAKIANVASIDHSKIAQRKAGDRIRFTRIDVGDAQALLLADREILRTMRRMLDAQATAPLPISYYDIHVDGKAFQVGIQELP